MDFLDGREEQGAKAKPKKATEKRTTNKSASTGETSIRVNTEKVDQLINQVGELVITQAMLMQISTELDVSEHDVLLNRLTQLERNTRGLARVGDVDSYDANQFCIWSFPTSCTRPFQ